MFRNSMLLRHVPCLLTIPYFELLNQGLHMTTLYLQDKLKLEVQRLAALPPLAAKSEIVGTPS